MASTSSTIDTDRLAELYLRFSHGDVSAIDELFADSIKCHLLGDTNLAANYTGKTALREFIARTIEINNSPQYQLKLVDVLQGKDYITFVGNVTARSGDASYESTFRTHDVMRLDEHGQADEMWSLVM
jgi:predicted SnoaL-like aldol condensation-catalyzing enzyme